MRIRDEVGLSFDDVLLVPKLGVLEKRKEASLASHLFLGWPMALPFVSAPMDSVTEGAMASAMSRLDAFSIIHRFMSADDQVREFKKIDHPLYSSPRNLAGVAIGINEGYNRWELLRQCGIDIFCLDIAHAHHIQVKDFLVNAPTDLLSGAKLIAGNVATAEGFKFLADLGVDCVKVGIGPGAACTTRTVTGFGVPQLTAIMDVAKERDEWYPDVTIMADGGIKSSGDVVKALAAGADTVMLGRLLAGADESPHPGLYWGMASNKVNGHRAPEGVEGSVPRTGPVEDTIKSLAWGVRSAVSYAGAENLEELRENAEFIRVTQMSLVETGARI